MVSSTYWMVLVCNTIGLQPCGIGIKEQEVVLGLLVLLDHRGEVIMHSRTVEGRFQLIKSVRNSFYLSSIYGLLYQWESIRVTRYFFNLNTLILFGMITNSIIWPSFKFRISELMTRLDKIYRWRVELEERITNRWAFSSFKMSRQRT